MRYNSTSSCARHHQPSLFACCKSGTVHSLQLDIWDLLQSRGLVSRGSVVQQMCSPALTTDNVVPECQGVPTNTSDVVVLKVESTEFI